MLAPELAAQKITPVQGKSQCVMFVALVAACRPQRLIDNGLGNTMAVLGLCFGLRSSECLALKWLDVDWLNGTLNVERGIVHQVVDDVKTPQSERLMYIDPEVLGIIKSWKQQSQFPRPMIGCSYLRCKSDACRSLTLESGGHYEEQQRTQASITSVRIVFATPSVSGLDAICTPLGVQKQLMRHTTCEPPCGTEGREKMVCGTSTKRSFVWALLSAN
jgi:hypothetical protein